MIDKLRAGAKRAWTQAFDRIGFGGSRWIRRTCITVVVVVVLFGLAGFVGVPLIAQYVVAGRLAASLNRPVTMKKVRFNPYTLRLTIKKLHIGDRASSSPFADIGHIRVKISWISLLRLAPIVTAVTVDRPTIHIVRTAEQRFNFSDLLESSGPKPAPKPNAKPQRFAVSNIQIHEGEIHLDDKVLGKQHKVAHLELDIPFIANLPADVDIFVQPLLQMVVDGSRLRVAGKAKPFAVPPESVINLNLHRLNLPLYMAYVPEKLPLKIAQGTFSSQLQVHFVNAASAPQVRVSGEFALDQIDVRDAADAPLAGFKHLAVVLAEVEPLKSIAHLGKIYLDGLTVHVVRNPNGAINLASLAGSKPASAATHAAPSPVAGSLAAAKPSATQSPTAAQTSAAATTPAAIATTAATPTPAANMAQATANASSSAAPTLQREANTRPPSPTDLSIEALELTNSAVEIIDNTVAPAAAFALRGLHAGLKDLRTVGQKVPAPFDLGATLGGGGSIAVKGAIDLAHSQAATDVTLDEIDLPALQGFAQTVLAATVASGKLTAQASVKTIFATGRFNVHAAPASVSVDKFELRAPHESESPIGWNKLSASIEQVDLAAHQAAITEVRSDGLHLFVRRERNGQLSVASLMRGAASPEATPSTAAVARRAGASSASREETRPARRRTAAPKLGRSTASRAPAPHASGPSSGSWRYQVASVAVEKTEIRVEDNAMQRQVAIAVAPLNLHLKNVSNDLSKPIALDLDGVLNRKGSFKVTGTAVPAPLKVDLRVVTRRLDLAPFDPYVTGHLNTTIASAALTMNGALGMSDERKEMRVSYRGDAMLGRVKMLDKVTNDSFLRWNSFSANGIDFKLGSGSPRVHVASLDLGDFFARIILNSDGHLNLRDVMASPEKAPTSLTRVHSNVITAAATPAPTPASMPSSGAAAVGNGEAANTPTPAASPGAAPSPAPIAADLAVGGIALHGGQVNYTDNFIRPNYSADLTDISGKVGSFGTRSTTPADVELQGKVNDSAPLEISGSVNPLTPLAFVDIKANAKGVELTDLSAYSTKYTGYPITKGTLTVDVSYLLEQQKLTAKNHIFIDQLTFGDKVESPSAINLPIRLAVAILKNSQGQIDLHLPVSGSLSDPEFSIGGILLHAFMGLIARAVTSPFNLIASTIGAGGGGEDLNYVQFAPGWASVTPAAMSKLDTVAKALQARPALKLEICGRVDPKFDREGLRQALVTQSVVKQKLEDTDQNAANVDLASVKITPDEYDKYLKRAYKAAKFDKPRDLLGLAKSLPLDEMKKLMLANTKVSDDDLKKLAEARADAVRKALSAKIDPARMLVAPPKLNADGIKDSGKTTRADLSLE